MSISSARDSETSVSVCIGTYNQAQYLAECIESVLSQTYPVQEIWVSDDASTDDTPEVMEEIRRLSAKVHYYRQPKNLGIVGNLNWVLSQPATEFIVRLDSDDRIEPAYVAALVDLMRKYPRAGYAHCNISEVDGHGVQTRVRRLHRISVYEGPEDAIRRNTPSYRVAGNIVLYRSAALKEANYYHPNASWQYAEDWDLCLRIAILGWGNVHATAPLGRYRAWGDVQQGRFKRNMSGMECIIKVYKNTLEPEYIKRGWKTAAIRKCMRRTALRYVDEIDSPLLSAAEREAYKALLRRLGGCSWLSIRIYLAEMGLNPLFRFIAKTKIRTKDLVKSCLRLVER
jgi:hypothetical protein